MMNFDTAAWCNILIIWVQINHHISRALVCQSYWGSSSQVYLSRLFLVDHSLLSRWSRSASPITQTRMLTFSIFNLIDWIVCLGQERLMVPALSLLQYLFQYLSMFFVLPSNSCRFHLSLVWCPCVVDCEYSTSMGEYNLPNGCLQMLEVWYPVLMIIAQSFTSYIAWTRMGSCYIEAGTLGVHGLILPPFQCIWAVMTYHLIFFYLILPARGQ